MSKKKFSEGLEDLLKDLEAFNEEETAAQPIAPAGRRQPGMRSNLKSFAFELETVMQDDQEEAPESSAPSAALQGKSKSHEAFRRALFSGLDSLIRPTIDVQEMDSDEQAGKKRLTVALEKVKLEKLKMIARMENSFMKDILISLIDEYIDSYSRDKGLR
ncbi:MAG: hypothetical protein ACR2K1_05230 [Saprospiraceae bacterium]